MMEKTKLVIEIAQKVMKIADDLRELAGSIQEVCGIVLKGLEAQPVKKTEPAVPMEKVRGVLAEKSRAGHTAEIREILKRHGADRLSAVDPAEYAAVMKEAEELGDE